MKNSPVRGQLRKNCQSVSNEANQCLKFQSFSFASPLRTSRYNLISDSSMSRRVPAGFASPQSVSPSWKLVGTFTVTFLRYMVHMSETVTFLIGGKVVFLTCIGLCAGPYGPWMTQR